MMDRQVATDSGGWLAGHNAGDPRRHHRRREGMKGASPGPSPIRRMDGLPCVAPMVPTHDGDAFDAGAGPRAACRRRALAAALT